MISFFQSNAEILIIIMLSIVCIILIGVTAALSMQGKRLELLRFMMKQTQATTKEGYNNIRVQLNFIQQHTFELRRRAEEDE